MSRNPSLCFLPEEFLARKSQRRTNSLCAATFLIAALSVASGFAISDHALNQIEADHATVVLEFNFASDRAVELAGLQQSQQVVATQAALTASMLQKTPRSFIVAEITNSIPPDVTLLELSIEPNASVRLIGRAPSDVLVSQFVNKLTKSAVLKNVVMTDKAPTTTPSYPAGTVPRFTLEMSIDPTASPAEPKDANPTQTTAIELGGD